jgi:hypothetical protein
VFPDAEVPEAEGAFCEVHHVALKDAAVLPEFDPEADASVLDALGVEVADVFEELWVLDAPPVMVGCTDPPLIDG